MRIKIPEVFMGEQVTGSTKRGLNPGKDNPVDEEDYSKENFPDVPGYIFVPSIFRYVAKQRTFKGLDWLDTHEELYKFDSSLVMPTIFQFIKYIKFLQNDYSNRDEAKNILEDILIPKEGVGEWLNVDFSLVNPNEMHHFSGNRINSSNLLSYSNGKLDAFLSKEGFVNIFENCSCQGLPTKNSDLQEYSLGKNVYYLPPETNRVAALVADSSKVILNCQVHSGDNMENRGVFPCFDPREKWNSKN